MRTAPSNTPVPAAPKTTAARPGPAKPAAAPAPAPAPAPEVLAGVTMSAEEIKTMKARIAAAQKQLAADKRAAREARAAEAKKPTARDYVRNVDLLILGAVGELIKSAEVPAELLPEVKQLLANQLHHLSSPERGWAGDLPKPARSEWR